MCYQSIINKLAENIMNISESLMGFNIHKN